MRAGDKKDVFYAQGVDYENVNKYYNVVKNLNDNYYRVRAPSRCENLVVDCFWNIVYFLQKIKWLLLFMFYL